MTPMQSIRRTFALAALATTVLLSQAVHAQVNTYASRVTVPFAFNCGGQTFAPGTYTIKMENRSFLVVSNLAQSGFAMVQGDTETRGNAQGYLMFRKYGDRYFLGEYHPANSLASANVVQTKSERRAAREFASNQADQGRIRLALLDDGVGSPRR
ncbi:MAG TPA: hypothetical protein VHE33_08705 [Acidobacteriaceae bacterium]|nr:hypothetical protein [Acidobacteriaceae bacterium]